jgi:hypothetical protein
MKTCTRCGESKPATREFFHKHTNTLDGLRHVCKPCNRASVRAWAGDNPEKTRDRHRSWYRQNRSKVRASALEWKARNPEKARAQRRKYKGLPLPTRPEPAFCECCGGLPGTYAMNLDHCHETGKFRGWLCGNCNSSIGKLGDNAEGLRKALDYLARAEYSVATDVDTIRA